eukprot:2204863-Rhodomonas_salina.1
MPKHTRTHKSARKQAHTQQQPQPQPPQPQPQQKQQRQQERPQQEISSRELFVVCVWHGCGRQSDQSLAGGFCVLGKLRGHHLQCLELVDCLSSMQELCFLRFIPGRVARRVRAARRRPHVSAAEIAYPPPPPTVTQH